MYSKPKWTVFTQLTITFGNWYYAHYKTAYYPCSRLTRTKSLTFYLLLVRLIEFELIWPPKTADFLQCFIDLLLEDIPYVSIKRTTSLHRYNTIWKICCIAHFIRFRYLISSFLFVYKEVNRAIRPISKQKGLFEKGWKFIVLFQIILFHFVKTAFFGIWY